MKDYTITIEETVVSKAQISADNSDEAMRVVSDLYNSGQIDIPSETVDVKFGITEDVKRKHILFTGEAYVKNDNIAFNNETFVNNLILIDSTLPPILAHMIKNHIDGKHILISCLTQMCADENLCNIKSKYFVLSYYIKKVTDFLYAALHGLKFDEPWNGECKTKGFYIFDNGVSFSMYDLKNMLDYIYENAYFEITDKSKEGERTRYTWQICL